LDFPGHLRICSAVARVDPSGILEETQLPDDYFLYIKKIPWFQNITLIFLMAAILMQ